MASKRLGALIRQFLLASFSKALKPVERISCWSNSRLKSPPAPI